MTKYCCLPMSVDPQGSSDRQKPTYSSLKRQAVCEVLDFSSQYGHDNGISYTIGNVVGEPSNYPGYGDFTQSLVFRTYGKWWYHCPSTPKPFKQSKLSFISQEFVDIKYADPVFPMQIEIYETYNPGAVVRILGKDGEGNNISRWFVLWSGDIQQCPPKSRVFSPPLQQCPYKIRQLRLEFNQTHLGYYTELDAVLLYGVDSEDEYRTYMGIDKIEDVAVKNLSNSLSEKLRLNHYKKDQLLTDKEVYFHILLLPSEDINKIFSYLRFPDLGNVAKTCKSFRNYAYDPLRFKEFNLQPYWSKVSDFDLQLLNKRCTSTERLNLSWCGPGSLISSAGFSCFLQHLKGRLRCLYLSCCRFLDRDCLSLIKTCCPELEEIDLSSCVEIPSEAFQELSSLTCLTRLNVYRTQITDDVFKTIARFCTKLRHVNLGGCTQIENYDNVMDSLKFGRDIISLDLWRSRTLTPVGIKKIAENCPNLEEIDVGWCFSAPSDGSIRYLVSQCPKLKKVFLTAVRSVCDDDLVAISENCQFMEQLDILGTSRVSKKSVERVLHECKYMQFFDVSFCSQLDQEWFRQTKARFPNVDLKKSVTVNP